MDVVRQIRAKIATSIRELNALMSESTVLDYFLKLTRMFNVRLISHSATDY